MMMLAVNCFDTEASSKMSFRPNRSPVLMSRMPYA